MTDTLMNELKNSPYSDSVPSRKKSIEMIHWISSYG